MITTKDLADELGISERGIRKRIASLNLNPQRERAGGMVLSKSEADKVRAAKNKPGPRGAKQGRPKGKK